MQGAGLVAGSCPDSASPARSQQHQQQAPVRPGHFGLNMVCLSGHYDELAISGGSAG